MPELGMGATAIFLIFLSSNSLKTEYILLANSVKSAFLDKLIELGKILTLP